MSFQLGVYSFASLPTGDDRERVSTGQAVRNLTEAIVRILGGDAAHWTQMATLYRAGAARIRQSGGESGFDAPQGCVDEIDRLGVVRHALHRGTHLNGPTPARGSSES